MSELGERLRSTRESLGLSLEDVSGEIRIRPKYLQALEDGRFSDLPGRVTTKGFLRNYARYLGLNPDEILEMYRKEVQEEAPIPVTVGRAEDIFGKGDVNVKLRDSIGRKSGTFYIVFVLVLAAVVGGWWLYRGGRLTFPSFTLPEVPLLHREATATPTPTFTPTATVTPVPTATPTVTPTATPTVTATPTSTETPAPTIRLTVNVRGGPCWIRVIADGAEVQPGEVKQPGFSGSWTAKSRVELKVGDAGNVTVAMNGQPLPPLGTAGEVVSMVWQVQGGNIVSATATPPLPTPTPS